MKNDWIIDMFIVDNFVNFYLRNQENVYALLGLNDNTRENQKEIEE